MTSLGDANKDLEQQVGLGIQQEYQFDFEHGGRRGTFVFRRPSLRDRLTMGVLEANLLGGADRGSLDQGTVNIARFFATFTTLLIDSPSWFDLDTEDEYALLEALFAKYHEVVNPFRRNNGKED